MPFPSDEQLMETIKDLLAEFKILFGSHPGFRGAHAKGILVRGTFTPSSEASKLSKAEHFNASSTPVWVRFSSSTGLPQIPDNIPDANPRGMAIRFQLPELNGLHRHTDIISHSIPLFPVRTGIEFLELLRATAASGPDVQHPTPVEKFLGANKSALAFVTYPKPPPVSYGTQQYYSVNAFKLVDHSEKETFIRYHIFPEHGVEVLDGASVNEKSKDYLEEEFPVRLENGPITFKIKAQVAEEGDITDNATIQWPEARKVVELGTIEIQSILPENEKEQKNVIFDPIPRIPGVEPSADPLLETRAALYLLSGKERRAA